MGHIRKLPSGKFQGIVIGPDGKQIPETFPLKSQAKAWVQEQEVKLARGAWRDPRAGKQKVKVWHERWEAARVVEPHTLRGDQSCIRTHVLPHWETWSLASITRLDVQAWIRRLVAAGVGTSAIHRAYNLFSSMMKAALYDEVIAVSPCRGIDLPPIAEKPPQWFTRDEAYAVLGELVEPWRTMCLTGIYTGLRWGELSGLHGHRIDWLRSRLFVVEVNTKSGIKQYPKSAASRREVPLTAEVIESLSRHMHGRDRDGVVFTTVTPGRSGRLLSDGNWRRQTWWPSVKRATYKTDDKVLPVRHYPPHVMRHTCASWLVQEGVSLYVVQHLLGHESHTTTQRYAHLAPDAHQAVTDAWARIAPPLHGTAASSAIA
ncbi:tyrosine-type recombinase/integrase [Embleya sp. NPDC059237]|uniref:tyrosine-type recombinase/integrase n=1 Tax=Embleya sp. NPDC059237 TaxID=3346784 RepID=UPI00367C117E